MVDEVRRRVEQDSLHRRGHKHDPLYKIRGLLRHGAEHPAAGRQRAERVIDTLHTCPIPELARLGRTLRAWRAEILAYFTTGGVSNGGTEAINGIIEKTRRLAHGFRNFENYRLRLLLAASGHRPYRRPAPPTTP